MKVINYILLISYVLLFLIGFPMATSIGGNAPYIMIVIAVIALIILVYLHSKINSYCCPKCKTTFEINFIKDFFSSNNVKGKNLKCPNCGYKGKME